MRLVFRIVMAAMLSVPLGGCAKLANPGQTIPARSPEGRTIALAPLRLRNFTADDLRIFEGGLPVVILMDNSPEAGARLRAICPDPCPYAAMWAAVRLDRSRSHTLRLVQNGREATVTVRPNFHFKWFFFDAFLGPLAIPAWIIDGTSRSWNYFGELDVGRALDRGGR